ncbi:CBS domain-containing protein [Streptomyces sp. NPDC050095]|uniref:CBS domain-containing protein n=1 Tax=unclassified Streptomyces TaxID=2593676 RepID=UPI00343CA9A5
MTEGVVAVRPDASLVEAAQLMRAQGTADVLVTDGGQLVGVLTDRDITVRAVADGADPLTVSADAVCTPRPVTVGPDEAVSAAATLMRAHAVRRLPVVQDGRALGTVSLGDLGAPTGPVHDSSRGSPGPQADAGPAG